MKYLPSKKLVAVILVIVAIVSGAFLWSRWKENGKEDLVFNRNTGTQNSVKSLVETISQQDSDEDGLPDWEEALWKTDAKNPDTDADGTSDGEEVKLGRNPAKKGPGDALEKDIAVLDTTAVGTPDQKSLNETDIFMRELLAKYFELKGSGNTSSRSLEELASLMSDELLTTGISSANTYRATDILMKSDNSPTSLRSYGEAMGKIFAEEPVRESELQVLSRVLESGNPDELEMLIRYQKEYSALVKKILSVPAPPALASAHVGLLNEIGAIASSVGAMSDVLTNPIRSLSGISQYQKSLKNIEEHMKNIGSIFNSNGIIFKKGENGYLFTSLFERM